MKPARSACALRALVEAVDLELQAVEAEVEDQVALEEPRGLVGHAAAAEVGCTASEPRFAIRLRRLATSKPISPAGCAVDLDHEATVLLRLGLRALDLGRARPRGRAGGRPP